MDLSLHLTLFATTGLFQAIAGVVGENNVLNPRYFKPGDTLNISCHVQMLDLSEVERVLSLTVSRLLASNNVTEVIFSIDFEDDTVLKIKEERSDGGWVFNLSSKPGAERVDGMLLKAKSEDCGIYSCRISFVLKGSEPTFEKMENLYCTNEMSESPGNHSTTGIVVGVLAVLLVVVIVIGLFRRRGHLSHRLVECSYTTHTRDSQLVSHEHGTFGENLEDCCHANEIHSASSSNLNTSQDDNDIFENFKSDQKDTGCYITNARDSQLVTPNNNMTENTLQEGCHANDVHSNLDSREDDNDFIKNFKSDPRDAGCYTTNARDSQLVTPNNNRTENTLQEGCHANDVHSNLDSREDDNDFIKNFKSDPRDAGCYTTNARDSQLVTPNNNRTENTLQEGCHANDVHSNLDSREDDNDFIKNFKSDPRDAESDDHTSEESTVASKQYIHQLLVVPRRPLGPPRRRKTSQVKCNTPGNIADSLLSTQTNVHTIQATTVPCSENIHELLVVPRRPRGPPRRRKASQPKCNPSSNCSGVQ